MDSEQGVPVSKPTQQTGRSPGEGCNGSHLLRFKPNTSGTKAGACIVLQSGSAEGHEKTYLNQVVAVPQEASLETHSLLFDRFIFTWLVELFLDTLHTKSPELAEAQRKAKFAFAPLFLLHSSQDPEFNSFMKMCQLCW